jgi:hypothetical protein
VHLQALLGDPNAARGFTDLAKQRFIHIPLDTEWLFAMSLLAETSVLLRDVEHGEQLYELLLPYADFNAANVPEGMRGSVSHYLGLLAALGERWRDAEGHFSQALESNGRMGLRPWLAATQEDYARMLLDRHEQRTRAGELLDAGIRTYRELGMHQHAELASRLRSR